MVGMPASCAVVCIRYNHDTCQYGRLGKSTLADPTPNPQLFRLQQREKQRHGCSCGHQQAVCNCSCPLVHLAALCIPSEFCPLFQRPSQLGEGGGAEDFNPGTKGAGRDHPTHLGLKSLAAHP